MSDRPRTTSRTTSRTPSSRPRKLAGQGPPTTPAAPTPAAPPREPEHVEPKHVEPKHVEPEHVEPEHVEPGAPPLDDRAGAQRTSVFAGARVTRVLLVVIVALTVAALGLAGYRWLGDDDATAAAPTPPEGEIAVPEGRPILLPWADAQAAATAAAESATTALATSWQDYDEQLEEAVALMTPGFAEEFRTTAEDSRAGVVERKLDIAVRVVAQSVVRANASEVQALLFLDQYTTKNGDETGTTVSPYRVLVTMVNTDGGWLVSDLATK